MKTLFLKDKDGRRVEFTGAVDGCFGISIIGLDMVSNFAECPISDAQKIIDHLTQVEAVPNNQRSEDE